MIPSIRYCLPWCITAVLILPGKAQQLIEWEGYTSYNNVICMLDLDTAVLVGSSGGLVNINCFSYQATYLNKPAWPMPDNNIRCIDRAPDGSIWIGSNCGLTMWQGNNWSHYSSQNTIMQVDDVTALHYSDYHHALFAGLKNGNLIRIDTSGWSLVTGSSGLLPQNQIYGIQHDSNGNIWVSTHSYGMYQFDGNNWQNLNPGSNPWFHMVSSFIVDQTGLLWVAYGAPSLLYSYNGTAWSSHGSYGGSVFTCMSADSLNNLWLSSSTGLVIFDGTTFSYHPANSMLTFNEHATHLYKKGQNIWVGYYYHGVDFFNGTAVTYFPLAPHLQSNRVLDIAFDKPAAKVWFATYNIEQKVFACSYNDTVWENITPLNSPITNAVITSIAVDSNSSLYLGTQHEGLWARVANNWTHYSSLNSNICTDYISTLAIDKNGQLLIGFRQGMVQAFSNGSFSTLIQDPSLKCMINHIEPENNALFWLATDTAGLVSCDYNSHSFFNTANSGLPSNHVEEVKINALHQYWIATDSGLAVYDGLNWSVYNTGNSGMSDDRVITLTFGPDSTVIIGTKQNGINTLKTNTWTAYTKCFSPLCADISFQAATGPDGRIFLGTNGGVNIFKTDNITASPSYSAALSCRIYPNPCTDRLTFEVQGTQSRVISVDCFNIYSQLVSPVYEGTMLSGDCRFTWDTGKLVPGMYFIRIRDGQTLVSTKLVKQ